MKKYNYSTTHRFIELLSVLIFFLTFLSIVIKIIFEISDSNLYVITFTLSLILLMVSTNQIHKWSHLNYPPYLIDRLQKCNLILNPNHHNIHHSEAVL